MNMQSLEQAINALVYILSAMVLLYFVLLSVIYFILLIAAYREVVRYIRRLRYTDFEILIHSQQTTPVSVLVPAFNEEKSIVESVHSFLKIHYPAFEIVVVNDGSKDNTLEALVREFDLRRSRRIFRPSIPCQAVRGVYVSCRPEYKNIVVIDKENGGKADALNAGVNAARYPLCCAIDADSILEPDALLKIVKPTLEDSSILAIGGIVRIANGCTIHRGRVIDVRTPKKWVPVFQVVEYLRAFLIGRLGWSTINSLLIISGAFGVFKKEQVVEIGGFRTDTVGEDMELVVRLHRRMMERKEPYRITFIPDPVCWTEAPETFRTLGRQRNRWHRGLLETTLIHRVLFANKQYGAVGLLAFPYYLLFELLGPVIESSGYLVVITAFFLGIVNLQLFIMFFVVAIIYGMLFSVGAVLLEEISFQRYPRPLDLVKLVLFALIENLGYRQLTLYWRLKAYIDYARGKRGWGVIQRKGFGSTPAA
ncbi:MAG: glycosyltransferase [Bacteroidota bacterium]